MGKFQVTPLEALKALMELIGDKDLPDNGELNGAAICDYARAAINSAENTIEETVKITRRPNGFECEASGIVGKHNLCGTQNDVRTWLRHTEAQVLLQLAGAATRKRKTRTIWLTLSDPIPDLECEECGKEHEYDPGRSTWDCVVLLDQSEIPDKILGAWCNEKCLHECVRFKLR